MIVSVNPNPTLAEFSSLMKKTDKWLNEEAKRNPTYFRDRSGTPLEDDVKSALDECAKGTPFENTIKKISGHRFPDIVAAKFYGVEVKSTKEDHWTSIGSSILESTRVEDVKRIFLMFGKLGGEYIKFLSRPYEHCLSEIVVTHMPRYRIDMQLKEGETIFDKMGVTYDELRVMDEPVIPVAKYYGSILRPGERLWWSSNPINEVVPISLKTWGKVPNKEKRWCTVYGCVNYPNVFAGEYDDYALWLATRGIVDTHIRDQFSAGGQEEMLISDGSKIKLPGVYKRVKYNLDLFISIMSQDDTTKERGAYKVDAETLNKRLYVWAKQVSEISRVDYDTSMDALQVLFHKQWGNFFNLYSN